MFGKKKLAENEGAGQAAATASAAGSAQGAIARRKKKSRRKKIIVLLIILAAAAAVGFKMLAGGEPPAAPVATGQISRMDVKVIIPIKGTVEGNSRAEISSSENREISSISVKEGDRVKSGQLLATLKPSDKEENDKYQKEQAQNNVDSAKFDYDSSQKLFEAGAISRQDYLRSQTAYENAKSALAALYDKKETKNSITSPIDGIVTRVNAKVGLTASQSSQGSNSPLFVVEDLSSLKMTVNVSEYDISKIKLGQPVTISAEVLGANTVQGVVSHIAPTGEKKDGSSKDMVIPVKIDIEKNDYNLIAGVTAKAQILAAESKNALTVPLDAIQKDPETGENCVFVVGKDNVLSKKVVETGLESDFFGEVISGDVKEGDSVVMSPTYETMDGQTVATAGAEAAAGEAAE